MAPTSTGPALTVGPSGTIGDFGFDERASTLLHSLQKEGPLLRHQSLPVRLKVMLSVRGGGGTIAGRAGVMIGIGISGALHFFIC